MQTKHHDTTKHINKTKRTKATEPARRNRKKERQAQDKRTHKIEENDNSKHLLQNTCAIQFRALVKFYTRRGPTIVHVTLRFNIPTGFGPVRNCITHKKNSAIQYNAIQLNNT